MSGKTAAIVGLGLMGGSLALDLRTLGYRIIGSDSNTAHCRAAVAAGWVDEIRPVDPRVLSDADVIVLAVPVGAAPEVLAHLAPAAGVGLITDMGSTKSGIVRVALAAGVGHRFVGAHPLAGDTGSGPAAARPGLFRGRPVFLCPTTHCSPAVVQRAVALWRSVGALPQTETAEDHDLRMAWCSHLPQAAASALADTLARRGFPVSALGPGGLGATRLAASSPDVWVDILLDNASEVQAALAALVKSLDEVRAAIQAGDRSALHRLLAAAGHWRTAASHERGEPGGSRPQVRTYDKGAGESAWRGSSSSGTWGS